MVFNNCLFFSVECGNEEKKKTILLSINKYLCRAELIKAKVKEPSHAIQEKENVTNTPTTVSKSSANMASSTSFLLSDKVNTHTIVSTPSKSSKPVSNETLSHSVKLPDPLEIPPTSNEPTSCEYNRGHSTSIFTPNSNKSRSATTSVRSVTSSGPSSKSQSSQNNNKVETPRKAPLPVLSSNTPSGSSKRVSSTKSMTINSTSNMSSSSMKDAKGATPRKAKLNTNNKKSGEEKEADPLRASILREVMDSVRCIFNIDTENTNF